ncbi:MAG: STAS domain-containing protein [Elainellaceae cyanobacterium]
MVTVRVYRPVTRLFSAADAAELNAWITESLRQGITALLIDLGNVLFMDSRGLGVLLTAQKSVKKRGGEFALCALQEQARMVLELTNTNQIFQIYDTPEAFRASIPATKRTDASKR